MTCRRCLQRSASKKLELGERVPTTPSIASLDKLEENTFRSWLLSDEPWERPYPSKPVLYSTYTLNRQPLRNETNFMSDTLTITEMLKDTRYWRDREIHGCQSPPTRQAIIKLIKNDRLPGFKEDGIWVVRKSDWREFKKQKRWHGFPTGTSNVPSLDRYPDYSGNWLTVKEIAEDTEYWQSRLGYAPVSKRTIYKMIYRQTAPLTAIKYRDVYFVRKADWEAFKKTY